MSVPEAITGAAPDDEAGWRERCLRAERRYQRERKARLEAEAMAEQGLSALYERERQQALLQAIAAQANASASSLDTFRYAIGEICVMTGWPYGSVHLPVEGGVTQPADCRYVADDGIQPFVDATAAIPRFGAGTLPARVMASRTPIWIPDVRADPSFLRREQALACGLANAIAFPVTLGSEVVAIVEFMGRAAAEPDEGFLTIMESAGAVIARVVERERAAAKLVHDATHDALTGLPNRVLFMDRLGLAVARARLSPGSQAVLFVDLDGFKIVNDSLGHGAGDTLLRVVASRFCEVLGMGSGPALHTLARLGGDEFTVLLDGLAGPGEAMAVAEGLLACLRRPVGVEGREVTVGASVGLALNLERYSGAADVMRDADLAMYRAKGMGKGRVAVFDDALHERALGRLALEGDLRRALRNGEFRLHYQPIVAIDDGRTLGFEALIRWERCPGRLTMPGDFIATAEETGLIVEIGAWAMREAAGWNAGRSGVPIYVSVNVSPRQFWRPDFLPLVSGALDAVSLDPAALRVEITENVAMGDLARATEVLGKLRSLGVRVSIDDFGTGYSSLSYLGGLPLDTLKIDRSFVSALGSGGPGQAIVRAIIDLARNLGLDVVAEGVECERGAELLRGLGCGGAQGYLFGKPADPGRTAALAAAA